VFSKDREIQESLHFSQFCEELDCAHIIASGWYRNVSVMLVGVILYRYNVMKAWAQRADGTGFTQTNEAAKILHLDTPFD